MTVPPSSQLAHAAIALPLSNVLGVCPTVSPHALPFPDGKWQLTAVPAGSGLIELTLTPLSYGAYEVLHG